MRRGGRAASQVVHLANGRGGEGFVAVSEEARRTFWLDRAKTAAIARHTTPSRSTRTGDPLADWASIRTPSSASTSNARPPQAAGAGSSCSPTWARHFRSAQRGPDFDRLSRGELLAIASSARWKLIEAGAGHRGRAHGMIDVPADAAIGQLATQMP